MRFWLSWLLILIFSISSWAAETKYSINLKDWPADIVARINKIAPEVTRKDLDAAALNNLIKKLDDSFNFLTLKLVKTDNSNELLLVGEIAPEVKVKFEGLTDISEPDAINTMGLSLATILDEDNLKAGVEKLSVFYRDLGFRSAEVKYNIVSDSTLSKTLVFTVNKKDQTKLTKINIEGLDPKLTETLELSLQRQFRLAHLTQDTLTQVTTKIRNFLSYNGFYMAQITPPQIQFAANELNAYANYTITPNQRYAIEVTNTHYYTHDYLEDEVLKLPTYSSKDGNLGSELSEQLKNFYIGEGYPHIRVLYYETKIGDRIHLYLNVEEGPLTKIRDFKVIGQYSRSEDFYKNKFYELASAKVQDHYYIKEDIETAAKNLLIYLQNDGFVNAKLSRVYASTDHEEPEKGLLVVQIEEGEQVKISSLDFRGVSPENLVKAGEATGLKVHQSLSLAQLETSLTNLKNFYQSEGYIEYKLNNENTDLITYSDNNSQAALKFDVYEGPKVVVQSIDIEGNTRTLDKLVLLELDFKIGDILNPAKIEESILRLQRTGYFNSVEIYTLEKDTHIANRNVVVKVVERDPGLRVLGAGVTDENRGTVHGYAGVAYRNFWGRGVGLSLRTEENYNFASIKFLETKHTLGFVWPYIFDTRARFRTSATRSTTIADITINKVTEANTAIFSIEEDYTSHLTGIYSYSVNTYFDHGIDVEDEIKYGYSSESSVIGSIGPALEYDLRDNIFNPTKGSFSRLAFEYAVDGLGNNNVDDFYRIAAETTHYFPIGKEGMVFAQSLRGGYLDVTSHKDNGVPFDKRGFLLGGRTTIRGFESNEFFPTTNDL
ncbi:MAG: POTRA domain-containing protein, partial [Pseudobdellovibrio sp.]